MTPLLLQLFKFSLTGSLTMLKKVCITEVDLHGGARSRQWELIVARFTADSQVYINSGVVLQNCHAREVKQMFIIFEMENKLFQTLIQFVCWINHCMNQRLLNAWILVVKKQQNGLFYSGNWKMDCLSKLRLFSVLTTLIILQVDFREKSKMPMKVVMWAV